MVRCFVAISIIFTPDESLITIIIDTRCFANYGAGAWSLENMAPSLEGFSMALFTRVFNWTKEEVEIFLVDVRKEMKDTKVHAFWPM